jgi:spore maturation protein CgeB
MHKSKVIVNDHWPDMRDEGFVSMKTFEFMANKAFFITDKVRGIEEISKDIVCYEQSPGDLVRLIKHYLKVSKKDITETLYKRYQEIYAESINTLLKLF